MLPFLLTKLLRPTKLSRKGVVQFVFFSAGGTAFFVVGYVTFTLLYGVWQWSWFPAKVVGDSLGWASNFAIQYFLAFRDERKGTHPRVVTGKFTAISLVNLVIDYAIVGGLKWLGVSPFIGMIVASQFFSIWKWLWYKKWVFRDNKVMTIEQVAKKILATDSNNEKPVLIAIEGYGGSGKSTLAEKLKQLLSDAQVIAMDDFIVKDKVLEDNWDKGAFDIKRLEMQVLEPRRSGKAIKYQKLIWQTNKLSDYKDVPNCKYLIVEGIASFKPSIADYYNFKIWVDTPISLAKERGRARDGNNENAQHWDLWADNDLRYQAKYHPEKRADFIVRNGDAEAT